MHVIATAGHVDHGKSTLVRALTGMEPDRWEAERRRGMTIDLGYAWTEIDDVPMAFVDVPGHERFIANTVAGLGPVAAVMFVVAADQGWQAQSEEHLAVISALGLRHAVLAVTRSDLADTEPTLSTALHRLHAGGLDVARAVAVSGMTGAGLPGLRTALAAMASSMPAPRVDGRIRLWIDRAFTITGAGTVVTGTLDAGTIRVGDQLGLGRTTVRVRGLQCAGAECRTVSAPARVAVNLRGTARTTVRRGDALLTPDAWPPTTTVDVRLDGDGCEGMVQLHIGTAGLQARVRPLGESIARLTLPHPLPLVHGDRALLRQPGTRAITGIEVLDADPPELLRRGAAARRARELTERPVPHANAEVARRGAIEAGRLRRLGFDPADADARRVGEWLVAEQTWTGWIASLEAAVELNQQRDPLARGLSAAAAEAQVGLPAGMGIAALADAAGLRFRDGVVTRPDLRPSLGAAERAVSELESRLRAAPFRAPDRPELTALGLGPRELAVAARAGRLLRLPGDVVLLADAAETAAVTLRKLPSPFTTSQARVALDTTRRVVIPLLEHLDTLHVTERIDQDLRRVR